jgi:hypothetical protein
MICQGPKNVQTYTYNDFYVIRETDEETLRKVSELLKVVIKRIFSMGLDMYQPDKNMDINRQK